MAVIFLGLTRHKTRKSWSRGQAGVAPVRALIVKEFLAVWKDKKSRAVLIGPPIAQLLVFGYAATYDVDHVATAIYNEDAGLEARELIARFEGRRPSTSSPGWTATARSQR